MSLTITIPDEFADVLGASAEERERRAREALALDLYREGKISLRRMGELAGVGGDYWAAENFRVLHKAPLNSPSRIWRRTGRPLRDSRIVILIVADTGPVNYLIQIGCIGLLARLSEEDGNPEIRACGTAPSGGTRSGASVGCRAAGVGGDSHGDATDRGEGCLSGGSRGHRAREGTRGGDPADG